MKIELMLEEFKLKKQQKNNTMQETSIMNLPKPENKNDEEYEKFNNLQINNYKSNELQQKNERSTDSNNMNIKNFANHKVFLLIIFLFTEFFLKAKNQFHSTALKRIKYYEG